MLLNEQLKPKKIDKEAWDFKKSMYSQMFDDLEHLGTSCHKIKAKIESLKFFLQDLPPMN